MSVYVIFNYIPSASGPHQGSAPGHRWGTSIPHTPGSPLAKIPAGARGAPTFFSEQGPGLSKWLNRVNPALTTRTYFSLGFCKATSSVNFQAKWLKRVKRRRCAQGRPRRLMR